MRLSWNLCPKDFNLCSFQTQNAHFSDFHYGSGRVLKRPDLLPMGNFFWEKHLSWYDGLKPPIWWEKTPFWWAKFTFWQKKPLFGERKPLYGGFLMGKNLFMVGINFILMGKNLLKPDGQVLPRKSHRLPISPTSRFCDLTILSDLTVSCESSLLSKIYHVLVVVLSFRQSVKRCKSCNSSTNNIYMFFVKNQLHYLQL